jgi:hypothetical protein
MTYSIDYRYIRSKYNFVVTIDEEPELLIPTPLDKIGMDILMERIEDFISDHEDDNVTYISIQGSDDGLGLIIDLYEDDEDLDPISAAYWFDDYVNQN